MQLSTLKNPSPIINVAPPAATEGVSDTARNEARFANLLRQNQAAAAQANAVPPAPHAEPPPRSARGRAPSPPDARPNADSAPHQAQAAAPHRAAAREPDAPAERATQRARQERTAAKGEAKPDTTSGGNAAVDDKPAPTASAVHGGTGVDPAPMEANPWLAALQLSRQAPGDPDAHEAGAAQDGAASGAAALSQASSTARARSERTATWQTDAQDEAARADPRASAEAGSRDPRFAATLAESQGTDKTGASAPAVMEGTRPGTAVMSVAASAPPGAAAADPLAATTTLALPTPVDSPDFAQALGVQLSVLARDGVQRAELHLNPVEMGPVSVHIVMDGTQARIDFGADHAATRQAIETGLPELASALRDAGFTLAGGGVSQHSRGQGDGGDAGRANALPRTSGQGGGSDGDTAATARPRRHTVRAGGVDLYA